MQRSQRQATKVVKCVGKILFIFWRAGNTGWEEWVCGVRWVGGGGTYLLSCTFLGSGTLSSHVLGLLCGILPLPALAWSSLLYRKAQGVTTPFCITLLNYFPTKFHFSQWRWSYLSMSKVILLNKFQHLPCVNWAPDKCQYFKKLDLQKWLM